MTEWDKDREVCEKATPGPWEPCLGSGFHECTSIHFEGNEQHPFGLFVCDLLPDWVMDEKYKADIEFKAANMEFIAQARHRWPAALDRIAELKAENDTLKRLFAGESVKIIVKNPGYHGVINHIEDLDKPPEDEL